MMGSMTAVTFDLQTRDHTGRTPAAGRVSWQATKRLVDGSVVVLPGRAGVDLPRGFGSAVLDPGVYWFVESMAGGESAYRIVPDVGPVTYASLAAVDPATLEPDQVPEAAWYAYTDTLTDLAESAASDAGLSRAAAEQARSAAFGSQTAALESATSAGLSAETALVAAQAANGSAVSAAGDASLAAGSELRASGFAADAETQAGLAASSATGAESARGSMVTSGTVDAQGHLILGRVSAAPQDAGYVVGPPVTFRITETTTGPDTPGTPGAQGLTGPKGDPGGIVLGTDLGTADLNTILTPGVYRLPTTVSGLLARNFPRDTDTGVLVVLNRTADAATATQEWTPFTNGTATIGTFLRTRNATTWGPWRFRPVQRVDQTAGRAIYTWDDVNNREQLVYGDTGRRTITTSFPSPVSGAVTISRSGVWVNLIFADYQDGSAPGNLSIPAGTIPAGFQPQNWLYQPAPSARLLVIKADGGLTMNSHSATVWQGAYTWRTDQNWPTALPGTPVGSIPNL